MTGRRRQDDSLRRTGAVGPPVETVALLTAWIAPIAATAVATPFVLDRIGPAEYGLYAVVLGLVVSMAALGMSRPLAISTAGDGAPGARRALVWGLALALGGALAVAGIAALIPLGWLVGDDVDPGHARLAVLAGAFAVFGTAVMSTVSGRVIGVSRFVAVGVITAAIGVATSVGYVTIAAAGGTAIPLVLWNGAAACLGSALFFAAGRSRHHRHPTDTRRAGPPVDTPSLWPFVVVQAAGNLAVVTERIGLAATTGLDAVTVFVVPHMMVLTLHAGLLWLTAPLLTRAVQYQRAGDTEGLSAMYRDATRLGTIVAALGGVTLAVIGHAVLDRWLGGNSVLDSVPFLVLTIYAVGLPLTVVPWNIADATGHADENAFVGIVWLGFVVVGAVATHWFGIDATVTARAALVLTLPLYIRRVERLAVDRPQAWTGRWVALLVGTSAVAAAVESVLWVGLGRTMPAGVAAVVGGTVVFVPLLRVSRRQTRTAGPEGGPR